MLDARASEALAAHARREYPRECCGVFLGTAADGIWRAQEALPARNLETARGADRYDLDPRSRLAAEDQAQALGLSVVGFYHSHPDHEAYFSPTDLAGSEEFRLGQPWLPPCYAYLVVSVLQGQVASRRAYLVENGLAHEITLQE